MAKEAGKKIVDVTAGLEVLRPHAAGIDVGNAEHYVAVPPGRSDPSVVAVGIPVARYPPHRSVRALLSAYGSYLRCVAANRSVGQGCNTRGGGSQRVAH